MLDKSQSQTLYRKSLAVVFAAAIVTSTFLLPGMFAGVASAEHTTEFPDGFEDGDITEWSGDTNNFTAQQSTVINGSYSGELSGSKDTVTRSLD